MKKSPAQRLWYKQIILKHESSLLRYCYGLTKDRDKAADLVQMSFMKLWEQDFFKVEGHVVSWLFSVCRNAFIDEFRKERKMTDLDSEKIEDSLKVLFFPEELIAKNEIFEVIKAFPPEQQEIFFLKFQEGYSNVEIGNITGLTSANIGVLLFRGLKKIREKLGVVTS